MNRPTTARPRRPKMMLAALAAIVAVTVSASHAWAGIPHTTTGVITGCRNNSSGALRVIDAQQGATCAAGETSLTWNAIPITATKWGSAAHVPLGTEPGISRVVLHKPGNPIPAGSWMVIAQVVIANSEEGSTFRCMTRTRGTLFQIGHSLQDWAGVDGWKKTITVLGFVTMAQPDWIDVYCSHDYELSPGVVQVEGVEVFVQRIHAMF